MQSKGRGGRSHPVIRAGQLVILGWAHFALPSPRPPPGPAPASRAGRQTECGPRSSPHLPGTSEEAKSV